MDRMLLNPLADELDEQLKFLKFTHGSNFQLSLACILEAANLQTDSVHSGGGAIVGMQLSSSIKQSRGSCEGAVLIRNKIGEATSRDVINNVMVVIATL